MVTELQFVAVAAFLIWGLVASLCGRTRIRSRQGGERLAEAISVRRDRGASRAFRRAADDNVRAARPRDRPSRVAGLRGRSPEVLTSPSRASGGSCPAKAAQACRRLDHQEATFLPGRPSGCSHLANGWTYCCRNRGCPVQRACPRMGRKPHANRHDARIQPINPRTPIGYQPRLCLCPSRPRRTSRRSDANSTRYAPTSRTASARRTPPTSVAPSPSSATLDVAARLVIGCSQTKARLAAGHHRPRPREEHREHGDSATMSATGNGIG